MSENTQTPMRGAVRDSTGDQVARDFYAAYLYLSMSAYFESDNLPGFARWMRKQYEEETQHALNSSTPFWTAASACNSPL
jgi:ferritin